MEWLLARNKYSDAHWRLTGIGVHRAMTGFGGELADCYTQRTGDTPRHAISITSRTQSED